MPLLKAPVMTILHHPVSTYIYRSAPVLSSNVPIKEEGAPDYNPHHFYPIHLGKVFEDSYEAITKLRYSTVWLARNLLRYIPHIYIFSLPSTLSNCPAATASLKTTTSPSKSAPPIPCIVLPPSASSPSPRTSAL
ncbi:hypothetical protein NEOLEDRAFT_1182630 [Neolentinus lepideus HHB14362 ss-1]|uniref:Uncharacterized protein n=1 Tax=Neolentinus lepideus HHB14362 ss-1 TaxID=1314782 RepID=A0A165NZ75_9AGAM|nr:hypothetical protein NEOLEDRAFT_1182630 [Neolentinus lepideus HHB14362 ss-1]